MRVAVCVRCGEEPRHLDTFMCLPCLNDRGTRTDMAKAIAAHHDSVGYQRAYLVREVGWYGGWHLRVPTPEGAPV